VLSKFAGQSLPEAIDRLGILPTDWDCWPPRPLPPQRSARRSMWMSGEPYQAAVDARQSIMIDRAGIDRALKESPLFRALRAGELIVEAKRRGKGGSYSNAAVLDAEVWQFERLVIQRSPPLLCQRVRKGEWAYFANPMIRLPETTAETEGVLHPIETDSGITEGSPQSRARREPAYEVMRRTKAELVRQGKIPREMPEGKQFDLVMRALPPGKGRGFTIDNFEKKVADWWPSDSDF
jgi:hypothetical protein